MSYRISELQSHLSVIRESLPDAMAVSVGPVGTVKKYRPMLTLEMKATGRRRRMPLSLDADGRRSGLNQEQMTSMGVGQETGEAMHAAGTAMHALNPCGAWCLQPQPANALPISARRAGTSSLKPGGFLADTVEDLHAMLPGIGSMSIDRCPASNRQRPKHWVRIHTDAGDEAAAIDTTTLRIHIRDSLFLGTDVRFVEVNRARVDTWAKQLNAHVEDMPEILHALNLLIATLGATHIQLKA